MPMLPARQHAVQLVAPDRLQLTSEKSVGAPGPHQILARVQCVGLCYSDMKLLHQFDKHPRKSAIRRHLSPETLATIPSYVPGTAPTVPGHEAVVEVVAIGAGVRHATVGGRYLVQADYRDLITERSNAAFGYNFEGALQEYVLLDERVTVAQDGEQYLLPVPADRAASQLALIEPWACVEEAFAHRERRALRAGGILVVAGSGAAPDWAGVDITACARRLALEHARPGCETVTAAALDGVGPIDDLVVTGGASGPELERLFPRLGPGGLAVVLEAGDAGMRTLPLGRIHYGPVRLCASTGRAVADALSCLPADGEVSAAKRVHVIGAGGPMG